MSVVSFLNQVNAGRKYKPWAISRTRFFKFLVILHNIFLAVYSAWTCVGMFTALRVNSDAGTPTANFEGDPRLAGALTALVSNLVAQVNVRTLTPAAPTLNIS